MAKKTTKKETVEVAELPLLGARKVKTENGWKTELSQNGSVVAVLSEKVKQPKKGAKSFTIKDVEYALEW